jgi:hypothetical protein
VAVDRVREVVEDEWAYLVGLLPANLDELAEESGALQRRRAVVSAQDLLRLALAYAAHDWSLRQTAAMAEVMGWQSISDVGVLKRLRGCPEFLRRVISGVLARRIEIFPRSTLRVCLVDATTVSRPGSAGVDWRLHVVYDLFALQLREVQVTDALGGESLRRFPVRPEEVYVGDRLYGTTPGILHMLTHDGTLIVRVSLLQVRLVTPRGGSLDLLSWLEELPDAQAAECPVAIQGDKRESIRWPLRLIAVRKSPEAAARAAEQAVQSSRKKGHAVMEETLILARYMVLLTNCEAGVTPEQALCGRGEHVPHAITDHNGVLDVDPQSLGSREKEVGVGFCEWHLVVGDDHGVARDLQQGEARPGTPMGSAGRDGPWDPDLGQVAQQLHRSRQRSDANSPPLIPTRRWSRQSERLICASSSATRQLRTCW